MEAELTAELSPRPSSHEDFSPAAVEEPLSRAGFYSLQASYYFCRGYFVERHLYVVFVVV